MSRGHVLVVGGGLAGIAAALHCADAGARVRLLERRPWLGGATWSAHRGDLQVDNGQHVFLRCCTAYRSLLERLGVEDRVVLQRRLEVPVVAPGGSEVRLRRHLLPAPAHLLPSLLRFTHVPWRDRLHALLTARRLARLDPTDLGLDRRRFGDWLCEQGERPAAIEGFWDLFVRATLNAPARRASLALAAKVFQTGLLQEAPAGDIGWARVPLAELHAEPGLAALRRAGVQVECRTRVQQIHPGGAALRVGREWLSADVLILAVPWRVAAELLPAAAGVDATSLRKLGATPIVNLHLRWSRPVLREPLVACLGSPLQWVFDRTPQAGLGGQQYLVASLSAAEAWVGRSRAELWQIFEPAFQSLFPRAREARLLDLFATCEREATFCQEPGSARRRPGPRTSLPRLLLAGAWTDTGWPATMEGAVRSGREAARLALAGLDAHPVGECAA